MNEKNKNGKKKSGGAWGILVLALLWLINRIDFDDLERSFARFRWMLRTGRLSLNSELLAVIFSVAVLTLVIVVFTRAVKKAAEKKGTAARSKTDAHGHAVTTVRRADPRTKSFSAPDPYCIVCDTTGEDHFARDKALRIAQLDDWLKNGLVDKAEYRALKDRFEKNL